MVLAQWLVPVGCLRGCTTFTAIGTERPVRTCSESVVFNLREKVIVRIVHNAAFFINDGYRRQISL